MEAGFVATTGRKSRPTQRAGASAPARAPAKRIRYPKDPATTYAREVVKGKIVAGKWVRFACERHLRDLVEGPKRGLAWRPELAEHVFGFFRALRLADGEHAGRRFELGPWQKFIVGSLFGWLGAEGYRRFRTAYTEIGKGSGKTPLAAGLGLYMALGECRQGAECYSAAVGRDQAGIMFRDASRFRNASPAMVNASVEHAANISFPALSSFFRPISSEGRGLDGKRVFFAGVDELHEHPSSVVLDKMRAGTKGWPDALIFMITNSGYDRHSVCYQQHEYSLKVLEGVIENDAHFAYVCALDEEDRKVDPRTNLERWMTDEKCWVKANPNLGVSIQPRYLRELVAEAREMPSKWNIVARLNFCVWTEQATRWLPMEKWDACSAPAEIEALRGRECFGGLDLASKEDIAALVWLFPPVEAGERWKVLARFWIPGDRIAERVKRARVPYDVWSKQGLIEPTDGNITDYEVIRHRILEDCERFRVREIAVDRWNATQLVTQLMEEGLNVSLFGQGYASMSAPAKELERLVAGELLAHGGNPVLRWMASNCAVSIDAAGNIKPDRSKATEKIDGIVALVMALGRAIVPHEPEGQSFWETTA
jgi:phage terminase large subunit-like protein